MNINTEATNDSDEDSHGHFKVHHYIQGGLHRMDAKIRNGSEAEILALISEIGKLLSVSFHVETKAYGEGGIEEYLVLIGQYKDQLAYITPLLGVVLSAPFAWEKMKQARLKSKLDEVNLAKARLELKKMEEETRTPSGLSEDLPLEPKPSLEDMAKALAYTRKIAARRSNLYKTLLKDPKIEAIGFSSTHRRGLPERVVKRADFQKFVIECEELPADLHTEVTIEIVAPVLRSGEMKWRGLFNKKTISFELGDWYFRQAVLNQRVQFQHGSSLTCDLEIYSRYNESGEPEITGYKVTKVYGISGSNDPDAQEQIAMNFEPPTS